MSVTKTTSTTITITTSHQPGCEATAYLTWSRSLEERYSKPRSLADKFSIGLALEGESSEAATAFAHFPRSPTHPLTPAHFSVLYMLVPGMAAPKDVTPAAVCRASLAAFIARSFRR